MEKDSNKLRRSAVWYAKFGWAVFPLKPREKVPMTANGFKDASKEVAQIMRWWNQWPDANIGIATGALSGFWVLDVDKDHGGYDTLEKLLNDYTPFERTPESLTGAGGNHVLFTMPDFDIRNNAGTKLGQGLDIRGNGGYIVAPPSIHPNGNVYQWDISLRPSDQALAAAPVWLLDKLKEPNQPLPVVGTRNGQPAASTGIYVSNATLSFFANGAPVGIQRMKALAAARNYMSAGHTLDETIAKVWQGLQLCEQEPGRPAWTEKDAAYLVNNLRENEPPPLLEMDGWATAKARWNQLEIEWIVCAAAYLVPEIAKVEMGWLAPAHFSNFKTRHFWELFSTTYDKDHAAHESGTLAKLFEFTPAIEPHLLGEYARQLASAAYLVAVSHKLPKLNLSVANADIAHTRQLIKEMDADAPALGKDLITASQGLEKVEEIIDNPTQRILKTFIPAIDRSLRGLEKQTQSIWAARAGLGKTTLVSQVAANIATSKRKVLIFELEMSAANWWGKKACGRLGYKWLDVVDDRLTPQQKINLKREIDKMKAEFEGYLFVDDRPQTTETIWQAVMQYQPELVMIDHLRHVKDQHKSEIQRLGMITNRLKDIAKLGDCHVATIHQIRRAVGERDNKRPQLDDLRDSGLIEEDGDTVLMLYRESYYEKSYKIEPFYDTELLPVKFRYDPDVCNQRIWLRYETQHDYYGDKPMENSNGHKNGHHKNQEFTYAEN